jgi:hypothetical protein
MKWLFSDGPATAVFTSRSIAKGVDWIYYVSHDADDGAWQFLPYSGPPDESEAAVVSLSAIVGAEPRVSELADLPLGWHAWRETPEAEWVRKANDQS